MANIFGMDIRRFSVLFIALIIIIAIFNSFRNIQNIQQNYNISINTNTIETENLPSTYYSYIYNKSIYLSPNINDLKYVYASFADVQPPNYTLDVQNYKIPIFFNLSVRNVSLLSLLINYLSRNASMITPYAYGGLLSIASSAFMNITNQSSVIITPLPLNANDTENYSKFEIIIIYAKNFKPPASFQKGWSYPPNDNITWGPLSSEIVNTYTLTAYVIITYSINYFLASSNSHGSLSCPGDHRYNYLYYDANVYYAFYYYVNENGSTSLYAVVSNTQTIPYTGGTIGPVTESTTAAVPGNSINVQATAGLTFIENETETIQKIYRSCNESNQTIAGNAYNITYKYYPILSSITNISNTYIFYEYNVTLPLQITVFNGTNPTTHIYENSTHAINFGARKINVNISYLVWSSAPEIYSIKIKTNDTINITTLYINRQWDAGILNIIPNDVVQTSGSSYYYYLDFSIESNIVKSPPTWIDEKMIYNKYAAIDYFYLEQNASLATTLMNYIKDTINQSDMQYMKFEYFVLASQYVMYAFNTSIEAWNNLLELESMGNISWALVNAKILNLSTYPNLRYISGLLQFYNISRIPEIYNSSIYFNISGNNEVYLVDIYNAYYEQWDRIPFGNPYSFGNISFYTFQNTSIPYVGEEIYFYNADFIPEIIYAIFSYSNPSIAEITAIWNGTAWIS
ncbi:hypothetical protein V6M85_13845 [Sulfolobus tengchongensis]|uniref:Uncharacterized protein n=1 Tax=Sulfolobus tengchongensis TaxID=207809 RepID=A0AAX4L159_9CREN